MSKHPIHEFSKASIGKAKVSHVLPMINLIKAEWGLTRNTVRNFNTAKRILIHSAKNN